MNSKITLLLFTCKGKEHLLVDTFTSFKKKCSYDFHETILAIDGMIDNSIIEKIQPDKIVLNYERTGYIQNILNALLLVKTEHYFWLEDDFEFIQEVPISRMQFALHKRKDFVGVYLSRLAPLSNERRTIHHFDEFYRPSTGFSVSPTLCKTDAIKRAFEALLEVPKGEHTKTYGFETFIDNYFLANNLDYALMDPGEHPHVKHIGQLESTAREYHMINSIDKSRTSVSKEYISGYQHNVKVNLKNKIGMAFKLTVSFATLIAKLFYDRQAYDYAFRIFLAYKKKFSN